MRIITCDKKITDGTMHRILQHLETDIPILLLSKVDDLDFNEEVLSLEGKKFVVIDVIEEGWNVEIKESLVLGRNKLHNLKGEGWIRLDAFLAQNKPYLYLKRELLAKDVAENIIPIEYPSITPLLPAQTREEFNNRPISVFHYWGRSHEARLIQHGLFWVNAAIKGYAVCDNVYYFNNFMAEEQNSNKWVSFNIPHWARIDICELLKINGMSKLGLSLPGCGIKCFRTTEIINNSVIIMPEDELAYSYPLVHGKNCLRFPINSVDGVSKEWDVINPIEAALKRDDLYDIYLAGLEAAKWYQVDNYLKWIESLINKILKK
jgi:hypothetical protein